MTLEETIKHYEEVIQEKQYEYQGCLVMHDMENAMDCIKCAKEHEQLVEWLKELKELKKQIKWIPINEDEELPEIESYAFITVHNQSKMCWYQNGVFVDGEQNAYTKEDEELVAWMPFQIPEPYMTESEE